MIVSVSIIQSSRSRALRVVLGLIMAIVILYLRVTITIIALLALIVHVILYSSSLIVTSWL